MDLAKPTTRTTNSFIERFSSKKCREESDKKGTLCRHCFEDFPSRFQRRFHKRHDCWHSPYEKDVCQKKICSCNQYWCNRKNCLKGFVTFFEREVHEKYYCSSSIPPFLTQAQLDEKLFTCNVCGKKYSTPGLLSLCGCHPEKEEGERDFDLPWETSDYKKADDDGVMPKFLCLICDETFDKPADYHNHDCDENEAPFELYCY